MEEVGRISRQRRSNVVPFRASARRPSTQPAAFVSRLHGPILGRERELDIISAALDAAVEGRGGVVSVEGDPGIGKTRLIAAAAVMAAEKGFEIRRGIADSLESGRPFAVLVDAFDCRRSSTDAQRAEIADLLMRPIVRRRKSHSARSDDWDAGEWDVEPVDRYAVQDAFVDLVEAHATETPLLIVLDDLQWADHASLSTIGAIARRADRLPIVVLWALRAGTRSQVIEDLIDRFAALSSIVLRPLGADGVAELASQVLGARPAERLLAHLAGAAGNPFMVHTALRQLQDNDLLVRDGPMIDLRQGTTGDQSGLSASGTSVPGHAMNPTDRSNPVLRRLHSLPVGALEVLRVAAIFGERFDDALVAAVLDRSTDDVRAVMTLASAAGLVEDRESDKHAFRHGLVREAVYRDVPSPLRSALHQRAAKALADNGASPVEVAPHLLQTARAGDDEAVVELLRASRELGPANPSGAVPLARRAVELVGQEGPLALEARLTLARMLLLSGSSVNAHDCALTALPIATALGLEGQVHLVLGMALLAQGAFARSAVELDRAVSSQVLTPVQRCEISAELANVRLWSFDGSASLVDIDAEIARADEAGAAVAAVQSRNIAAMAAALRGDTHRALRISAEALDRAPTLGDAARPSAFLYRGLVLTCADRFLDASIVLEEGRRRSERRRDGFMVSRHQAASLLAALLSGSWDSIPADADGMMRFAAETGSSAGMPLAPAVAGLVALRRGDRVKARQLLEAARRAGASPTADTAGLPFLAWLDALVAELDGDVARGAATMFAMVEFVDSVQAGVVASWLGIDTVRLHLASGDVESAMHVVAGLDASARTITAGSVRAVAAVTRAMLEGDPSGCETGAAQLARVGRRPDAMLAREQAARLHHDRGDAGAVARIVGLANADVDWLGAADHRERLRSIRDPHGPSPATASPARAGLTKITKAERQVLALLGEGRSNVEIAAALFVSKRTVESHVSNLYAKVGVSNRVALAAFAAEQNS